MKETAATKARRYLTEGRVVLTQVSASRVTASVRGDGAFHLAGYRHGAWSCSCPARTPNCAHLIAAHLIAVRLCTAVDLPRGTR